MIVLEADRCKYLINLRRIERVRIVEEAINEPRQEPEKSEI